MLCSILKHWRISLEPFEGNMDGQKYVDILENNINKTKEILQKKEIAVGYDSKHKSNVSLKF